MAKYDYLIVGAGFFGATCARILTDAGKSVMVIDERVHVGGNCYTKMEYSGSSRKETPIHVYGAHIFHTSNKKVYDFITKYGDFDDYEHRVFAWDHGTQKYYTLPFNTDTFIEVYGTSKPVYTGVVPPGNLEELAINTVGEQMYKLLIRDYTKKQWGRHPRDLPLSIIKRIPVRDNDDASYFNDDYVLMPKEGYTPIFINLLKDIETKVNTRFNMKTREKLKEKVDKIIFTGPIDSYFDYKLGTLDYRSLKFREEYEEPPLDVPVINYPHAGVDYTRKIFHNNFYKHSKHGEVSTVYYEYPEEFNGRNERFYPIPDKKNLDLYKKYKELADQEPNVYFGGRLGTYKYLDMDATIAQAMSLCEKLLKK